MAMAMASASLYRRTLTPPSSEFALPEGKEIFTEALQT